VKNILFTLFSIQKVGLSFSVKVTPRAKKNQVGDVVQDTKGHEVLKIAVTEAAEDGKANDAVIALLAKASLFQYSNEPEQII
jgi:hypothetical protein